MVVVIMVLLDLRRRLVLLLLLLLGTVDSIGCMAMAERLNVVLEGPLVLEIRPTSAVPQLPAVLLVGSPVPSHRERLAALAARERLDPVPPLVVGLESPEVLEWL